MKLARKRLDSPGLGGILSTRQGAVTLALVCALAATAILIFAIGKYRHAVTSGPKQDTVLVATSEIQKGTPASTIASGGLYKVTPVLATQVSSGAIVNAASLSGKVAAVNILPGQQLTSADFTTLASAGGIVAQLAPGERAIAVSLDASHGTGVLQTGDHVDVYASLSSPVPVISLLVPDAVVLQAPSSSGSGSSGGTQGSAVVLGVSTQMSPRVMWAFDNGKLWLALRGPNATNPKATVTGVRQELLGNKLSTTPTYATASGSGAKP